MTSKNIKSTGLGADAFFQTPSAKSKPTALVSNAGANQAGSSAPVDDRTERRSFNLKLSTLRLLDEVQIKTMRDGRKSTLSAIVERGIELAAKEMGVSENPHKRVTAPTSNSTPVRLDERINE